MSCQQHVQSEDNSSLCLYFSLSILCRCWFPHKAAPWAIGDSSYSRKMLHLFHTQALGSDTIYPKSPDRTPRKQEQVPDPHLPLFCISMDPSVNKYFLLILARYQQLCRASLQPPVKAQTLLVPGDTGTLSVPQAVPGAAATCAGSSYSQDSSCTGPIFSGLPKPHTTNVFHLQIRSPRAGLISKVL